MAIALFVSILLVAACGLIYELIAGTVASYLVGDSVFQFSTVIGAYLFAMGIGSFLSRFLRGGLAQQFIRIELLIALVGGFSSSALFLAFAFTQGFQVLLYLIVVVLGTLVGLEIPLLMRLIKSRYRFQDAVSHVLTFDYIGALFASVLFPLVIVPRLGLVRAALFFGVVNAIVALWSTRLFKDQLARPRRLQGACALTIAILSVALVEGARINAFAEDNIYADEIIFSRDTRYQHIVLTKWKDDLRLFLNSHLQFSSRDEYRYHEALVHPGLASVGGARRVLVLGGGDGLAVREILRYPHVAEITLVDLDPDMTRLFSTNPLLTRLNQRSLLSPRVRVVNADAFLWVDSSTDVFDFVVVDFPDPTNYSLGKLYTTAFFTALGHHSERARRVRRSEHVADVRSAIVLVHRGNGEAGGISDVSVSRLRAVVRRVGVRAGKPRDVRPARRPPRRTSIPRSRKPADAVRVPLRHGARRNACQPPERSGSGQDARSRMAGNHPLKTTAPTRREFCRAAAALVGLSIKGDRPIAGGFVNDDVALGHAIRERRPIGAARDSVNVPVVIVGGGIAGLSAAWRLQKRGIDAFVVLEMNAQSGGNSRWGENGTTAYPWAAHYVPVPGKNAAYVRELFSELGVLKPDGTWDERYLCLAPQERLFIYGRWQEGIEPATGLTATDREQFRRLAETTDSLRTTGRFTVPIDVGLSSQDESLDRVSFGEWLAANRFDSKPLLWYMDYVCRDDYGAMAADVSAWAGLHYFSSRENEEKGPLTWPEGNGWIVKQLLTRVGRFVRPAQPVRSIRRAGSMFLVRAGEIEYRSRVVIFAAPTFLAPYIVEGLAPPARFEYSPWLTANLTLEAIPDLDRGEPAWDNVVMGSPTLGYVDAMHQSLRTFADRTVWTFYWALANGSAPSNRGVLLGKDWSYWKEAILSDLERVHPSIRKCVSRIDVMRMGHAMVRPTVGSVFSRERQTLKRGMNGLLFAHSDVSGLSLFEEAQYRGVVAADRAIQTLG